MAKSKKPITIPCPDCSKGVYQYLPGVFPDVCSLCGDTGVWSDEEPEERFLGRYDLQ